MVSRQTFMSMPDKIFAYMYLLFYFQNETALCRRFTTFVTKYNLMSKDNLIVPILEEQQGEPTESEAWRSCQSHGTTEHYTLTAPSIEDNLIVIVLEELREKPEKLANHMAPLNIIPWQHHCMDISLTLQMLRLFLSKAQGCKEFWKVF